MATRGNRIFAPFPEFVDPDDERGYTVHDINDVHTSGHRGTVDRRRRRMATSFTISGAIAARQQLGKATWSPMVEKSRKTKLLTACIRAVEDARVNMGLRILKMPVVFPRSSSESFQRKFHDACDKGNITSLVIRATSGIGSNLEARYAKVLREFNAEHPDSMVPWVASILSTAHKKMKRARGDNLVFTHEQGVRIARWIANNLRRNDSAAESRARTTMMDLSNDVAGAIAIPAKPPKRTENYGNIGWGWYNRHPGRIVPFNQKLGRFYGHDWDGTRPGKMTIRTPHRPMNIVPPKIEKIRKHTATDEGVEFKYIERFVTDQMVFRRKRKKREGGGSVLIDVSGSMSLDEASIEKIIKGAPEATLIAIYSGQGDEGELRVIVADGSRHYDVEPFGGSNVIDVPALEWLSVQAPPRVWLSDGGVTGINDACSATITAACETICKDNFIRRCDGVDAVVRALLRQKE